MSVERVAPTIPRSGVPLTGCRNARRCSAWSTCFSNRPCACRSVREEKGVNVTAGTVKKVIADRGFGFIAAEDGKEYFFHRDALQAPLNFDRLNGGEAVTFEVQASPKGPRATNVQAG